MSKIRNAGGDQMSTIVVGRLDEQIIRRLLDLLRERIQSGSGDDTDRQALRVLSEMLEGIE